MSNIGANRPGDNEQRRRLLLRTTGDVAIAVMTARKMARSIGLKERDEFLVGTAVSELATNVIRYAEKGEAHLQVVHRKGGAGIEVVVKDKGPGIADMDSALKDHSSTQDSLGLGLPSVKRMMDEFTLVSNIGQGTRATIRKWHKS
ncbi:MAG: anti-sigma regulatory factor [Hyphomicrobiales bacterium]